MGSQQPLTVGRVARLAGVTVRTLHHYDAIGLVSPSERALAAALADGVAPDAKATIELAERHRRHIARWFYDCSSAMHRRLGQMYVAD
jgi:hypothetical protein